MSSIVLGEERVTDEQEVSDAPQSASIQPTAKGHAWEEATLLAKGGDEELNWSSYSRGSGKRSAGGFRGLILLALFAVLIPALIISFVRAVCRASTSAVTNREAGASIRRLSDSEESNEGQGSVSQLLEECASIEEELGLSLLEETDPARALDEAEEVARVAFQLYQEAIAFEREMQRSQQTANPTFPSFPSSSSGIHEPQDLGQGAVHTTGLELADVGPEHLTTGLTIPELQPGNLPLDPLASYPQPLADASQPVLSEAQPFPGVPEDFPWSLLGAFANPESSDSPSQSTADPQPPVAAPQTISLKALLLQNSPQRSPRKRTYSEGPQQEPYPGLEPDSWLDNVPLIDSSPEGQRQSEAFSPNWASPDEAAPCSGAACQFSAGAASSGSVGQEYSTASAAGAGEAGAPAAAAAGPPAMATARPATDWIRMHPYVHQPTLQEGVVPPPIQLSSMNFQLIKGASMRDALSSFRYVFSRESLNQMDANFLVGYVHELASAAAPRARVNKRMPRPGHGVVNIGQQFLALDAIVSALQVLGVSPTSCTWWDDFAKCFDSSYRYAAPGYRTQESGLVNIDIANRMLSAIAIYKMGKRPDLQEIIDIKHRLFFSPHMPSRFKDSKWDPWRSDHSDFEAKHPEVTQWLANRRYPQ